MDIRNFIKVYNVIPADLCNKIIQEYGSDDAWKTHEWYTSVEDKKESRHNKELDVLFDKDLNSLEPYIGQALMSYYAELNINHLVSYHSKVRLNKYSKGKIMSEHTDLIRRNKQDGIPVLTFLGMLNDNYKGGQFLMNGEVIEVKQGDIIMFPSTVIHRANVQKNNTRKTIISFNIDFDLIEINTLEKIKKLYNKQ
jgi:predicted 2-oxoglutarate/Fe(II)-dependent dioxygenase YbiX